MNLDQDSPKTWGSCGSAGSVSPLLLQTLAVLFCEENFLSRVGVFHQELEELLTLINIKEKKNIHLLQLYQEEPCGSQAPRHTQQNSV
jgi:hypothetical protein